jgi:monomeric sarcosine oxidase
VLPTYDVIVLGTGGVGSAAMFHLALRGVKVLGLDRFPPGHDRGSSHGRTRIIRQAYFEHPDYVPLLKRAYELWEDLSQRCGKQLYHEIGLLQVGQPDGKVIPGVLESAQRHGLEVERLTAREAMARFPAFRITPTLEAAVFERHAGYLDVEDCVLAHHTAAQKLGVHVLADRTATGWRAEGDSVIVRTRTSEFRAAKLIITAGPWANSFLGDLGIKLEVRRQPVFWYPIQDDCLRAAGGCPAYLFDTLGGVFYGISQVDDWGFKIAQHDCGQVIDIPERVDREIRDGEVRVMDMFADQLVPRLGRPHLHHSVCLYTMSPDENFIVDLHPRHPQVSFAAGLSGHGFKFTCVLGEILADLALNGRTDHPIGFLNCRRFGTV